MHFSQKFLSFHHERLDNILPGDLSHRHAIFEYHPDTTSKRDSELRVMRFAWTIHRTTHDRKVQRLLDMSKPALDLFNNPDEVIDIKPPTSRTSQHRHATRSQSKRLHDLPRYTNLFLWFRSERDANRVTNSFMQQNSEPDRRFHSAAERSPCFRDAKMKRIVDLFGKQSISSDCAMHVRSFQRDDDVGEVEIFEDLNVPQR